MISILMKFLYFATVFTIQLNYVNCEVFTSITDMEYLLKYEGFIMTHLNSFISKQDRMLAHLRKYVRYIQLY